MMIIQIKYNFRPCIVSCGAEKEAFSAALQWIDTELGAERSPAWGFLRSLVQNFYAWLPG